MRIRPEEIEIIGKWIERDGVVTGDEACERVKVLASSFLRKLGADSTGWDTLFIDPDDGRHWERTYLTSWMHGGGPPSLFVISEVEARKKYPNIFDDGL